MGNTILLADKSITIQKIVELTFADDNYAIRSVSDGVGALEAIPRIRPDLILADISLPGKSGYDLCRTLRNDPEYAEFANVPVILLAGIYETMDEERTKQVEENVREVQANDFLSKPFDPQTLVSKVKKYMQQERVSSGENGNAHDHPNFDAATTETNLFAMSEADADLEAAQAMMDEPYDEEKTMVLPQSPFASNLFAEAPPTLQPEQAEEPAEPSAAVDIDMIKPVDEPVFDPDEMPDQLEEFDDDADNTDEEVGELVYGSEAIEQLYIGGAEDKVDDTDKIRGESSVEEGSAHSTPVILAGDEPFADVFEESVPTSWVAAASSEEDSPFGEAAPPEVQQVTEEPVQAEIPVQEEQAAVAVEEASLPETQAESFVSDAAPYDDTWPGVNLEAGTQHVEELFESDAAEPEEEEAAEMAVTDLTEEEEVTEEPATVAAEQSPVNEEFIDRIVEKVLARLSDRLVSEIVWQVVPDLAEKMIRRELEKLHAGEE